jgi:hypothetical protein
MVQVIGYPLLVSFHPETTQCHSERSEESLLTALAMRFFVALLLRMTSEKTFSGWKLVIRENIIRLLRMLANTKSFLRRSE